MGGDDGRARVTALRWVLVPFCVYGASVALLGDWIIDDAGISFAYARNIAAGHGVVAQPGVAPVEGFSNFLWVLLFVPTFWLGVFDAIWLPKIIGALFVLGSLLLVHRVLARTTGRSWPGGLAALLIGSAPAIAIWTASGLENGLLLALVLALWALATLRPPRWAPAAGVVSAAIAMTRPDGLVYAAAVPLLSALEITADRRHWRGPLLAAVSAVGAFTAVYTPFFVYRMHRFGLPFPHTYYAKLAHASQGERLAALLADTGQELRDKIRGLGQAVAGSFGVWLLAACAVLALLLVRRRQLPRSALTALVLLALASFAHVWLPDDWMGEFRFATAAVALAWLVLITLAARIFALVPPGTRRDLGAAALALAVGALVLPTNLARLIGFARNPPTPYALVERQHAHRLNAYADSLGVADASILIADIGAMLVESRLRVYDAAGLIEPQIVRTIRKGTSIWQYDHPEFYDWFFEDIRPTFVIAHGFWANVIALEFDPRFARDYVALDAFPDEYVKSVYGRVIHSGEFVRRDALKVPGALEKMRASYSIAPEPEPPVYRIPDWLNPDGSDPTELRAAAERALNTERNPNRASALLRRLLVEEPDDLAAREQLATALDRAGRSGEARPEWERLARLPSHPGQLARIERAQRRVATVPMGTALLQYAAQLRALGRDGEARATLQRSVALAPELAEPHFVLGLIAQKEQNLVAAVAHYRRCLELDPSFVDAHNNLGFSLSVLGHHDQAVPILERALELRPDHTLARANLAWARSEASRRGDLR